MTYLIEMTYPTVMGRLNCNCVTGHEVATNAEAETVRDWLLANVPGASVAIKRGRQPNTVDEALSAFVNNLREYPARTP